MGALGCAAQLDTRVMSYIKRIEPRRVEIADPETGLVFGLSQFRHPMEEKTLTIVGVPGVDHVDFPTTNAAPAKSSNGTSHGRLRATSDTAVCAGVIQTIPPRVTLDKFSLFSFRAFLSLFDKTSFLIKGDFRILVTEMEILFEHGGMLYNPHIRNSLFLAGFIFCDFIQSGCR